MPARLSDPAWVAFQNDIDVSKLNLPPWGGIVQWVDQLILVYVCPASGGLCQKGEVMLTDVSDMPELIKNIPGTYDANQGVWTYHILLETLQRIVEVSKATLETTGKIIQVTSDTIGEAAGGLTRPLLENLALPLIVIGLIFLFMETRR